MGAGKRKQNFKGGAHAGPSSTTLKQTTRNLKKDQLGGVIFGCTNNTINECLSKQIFGLPAQHFSYVKNIDPGLPLFLFNYSKRLLHGIFEAASPGQMNINPYGWTMDGLERTSYPAQVQIRIRINCPPISENQFAPIIKDNYYTHNHFWFELDYSQASKLISLFSTQVVPVTPSASVIRNVGSWQIKPKHPSKLGTEEDKGITPPVAYCTSAPPNHSNRDLSLTNPSSCLGGIHDRVGCDTKVMEDDQREGVNENSQKPSVNCEQDSSPKSQESSPVSQLQDSANVNRLHTEGNNLQKTEMAQVENVKDSPLSPSDIPSIIAQVAKLMQEVQELKTFKQEHISKLSQLEQKQVKSESDIQQLKDRCTVLEYFSNQEEHGCGAMTESYSEQPLDSDDTIFLVGGYDGESWLSSLDLYSPSNDIIKSLKPMSSVRSYTSVAKLNDDLYVIGGGAGSSWYDTVESYNTVKDDWRLLPCLNAQKGSLAAATLNDKIFAIGGGNGQDSFSDVEMFDLNVGRWISARSMLQKRFALGAVELNGALYAVGGYDGKHYLRSGERFDPREHSWSKIESMNTSRGSHSLVVLNEKLYAIGGFDGSCLVASVEVLDPRHGTWMTNTPMNLARGYSAAVVLSNAVYVIGGWEGNDNIADKVERYEEGHGWQLTNLKAIGKRCYASALVP